MWFYLFYFKKKAAFYLQMKIAIGGKYLTVANLTLFQSCFYI